MPLLLYRWMLRAGADPLAVFVVRPGAQLVFVSHAVARPHVVTYLLFFTLVVARLDDGCAGRRAARSSLVVSRVSRVGAHSVE